MVIWSEPAKSDLHSIYDFIAHDSHYYAAKVAHDIREKTNILEELPQLGKKVPELNIDEIRELSLYSYRIIYEINNDDILVLAIAHKRQNLNVESIT